MINLKFRTELKRMLEENKEDKEIIKYVLNHAWEEWGKLTLIWFFTKIREYE